MKNLHILRYNVNNREHFTKTYLSNMIYGRTVENFKQIFNIKQHRQSENPHVLRYDVKTGAFIVTYNIPEKKKTTPKS